MQVDWRADDVLMCASSMWEKLLGFPMPDGRSFLLLTLELLRAAAAVRQTRRLVTIDFRISLNLATAPVHKAAAFEAAHTPRSGQSIPSELSLYESKLIIIWAVGTRPSASLFGSILVLSRCVRRGDHPSDRAPILHPPPTWRAVGFRCSDRDPCRQTQGAHGRGAHGAWLARARHHGQHPRAAA